MKKNEEGEKEERFQGYIAAMLVTGLKGDPKQLCIRVYETRTFDTKNTYLLYRISLR